MSIWRKRSATDWSCLWSERLRVAHEGRSFSIPTAKTQAGQGRHHGAADAITFPTDASCGMRPSQGSNAWREGHGSGAAMSYILEWPRRAAIDGGPYRLMQNSSGGIIAAGCILRSRLGQEKNLIRRHPRKIEEHSAALEPAFALPALEGTQIRAQTAWPALLEAYIP